MNMRISLSSQPYCGGSGGGGRAKEDAMVALMPSSAGMLSRSISGLASSGALTLDVPIMD